MNKKAYIFLADGFETIEALTPVDVLRRCATEIVTVSVTDNKRVISSHNIPIEADTTIDRCNTDDGYLIIIPGGYPGYVNLLNSEYIEKIMKDYYEQGKYIAAICAGPSLLETNRIAYGTKITCHSSVKKMMEKHYVVTGNPVEKERQIITAIGAGHALDFALAIAEVMTDKQTVEETRHKMELESN